MYVVIIKYTDGKDETHIGFSSEAKAEEVARRLYERSTITIGYIVARIVKDVSKGKR